MPPVAAPDQINPGIEDVIADAERHKHGTDPIADQTMVLNMGPQHPSTHGVLRLVLELDGETVVTLPARYRLSAHRHREGIARSRTTSRSVTLTDRVDYLCAAVQQSGLLPGGRKAARAGDSRRRPSGCA